MSRKAGRQARKAEQAARRDAHRDRSVWTAAKGHARDDTSRATFQRGIDNANRRLGR